MSLETGHHDERFPQEPDVVNNKKIMAVGFGSLVVFGLGILWAIQIYRKTTFETVPSGETAPAREVGKKEIGMVNQWMLHEGVVVNDPAAEERWLTSYGWIDRAKGIIHIPIEQAMEQVIAKGAKK